MELMVCIFASLVGIQVEMMEKKGNSLRLAELLRNHREEIVAAWAKKVMDIPNTHYQQFPLGEVTNLTSRGLETIIETFETNSDRPIEKYIK
jgi:hypothetical protein